MGYIEWYNKHANKHKLIVDKLISKQLTKQQIIDYFEYDNMVKYEIDFCPLYIKNKKCHDIEILNCYLCACPNFRFNDNGIGQYNGVKILSRCNINNGETIASKSGIHQNCSNCSVPHHKNYVEKNFSYNWKEIMHKSII